MSILKKLELFRELDGYLGASVYSSDGKMLGGVTEVSGVNFEIAGSLFHDLYLIADNHSKETGFGSMNMIRMDTATGIIFIKCYRDADMYFHTLLVVKHDSNEEKVRELLSRVIGALTEEFGT
ncbi:MAG: hypothetical protein GY940_26520 [bacterium]|nr:hypothetical protein [bacterium]